MKYAFIDYENLHSLDGLELQNYKRIFLFIGANQTNIRLTEKFDDEINVTFVTIKDVSSNNVDFHIAYYLGKLDATVDKNIEFHILSKDQGYNGICSFIRHQRENRHCSRIAPAVSEPLALPKPDESSKQKIEIIFKEYKSFMVKREKKHLPTKTQSLRNNIHNQTSLKGLEKQDVNNVIIKVINKLSQEKLLKITDSKVSYP
ncbi:MULTISPECIES: PIN domain-containing protein [Basfia]|uniref:PIN-like domain-containing protein n=1 Tax=Mannheimia succiniciproducens (strain KCTC 0769BP / MBEL55E) TaxID=221988 RepID=Q65R48_MANSM|nr:MULTISPECIES: PIN domain-containing protein [Basfia]AAU38562.1 unknown [[Mannheimia] succiniciproducens MBEL55E]SEP58217.1 hypothetical protein SAMN02910415_00103 [Basfia succiniciproducens]